jgi:hypothetical protein
MMGATCGTGSAYPSRAPEFTPQCFSGDVITCYWRFELIFCSEAVDNEGLIHIDDIFVEQSPYYDKK